MKIIKNSRTENKPVQILCYSCKSVLEVEPTDIVRKHYDQRDGNNYQFCCPVCTKPIYVGMSACQWHGI